MMNPAAPVWSYGRRVQVANVIFNRWAWVVLQEEASLQTP